MPFEVDQDNANKHASVSGSDIYEWAKALFPMCRSLTGKGTLNTLSFFRELIPDLQIKSVPSGTKFGDWVVPDEWQINDAYIKDPSGTKILDFQKSNLHVIGYSEPVNTVLSLDDLQPRLRSLPHTPEAIPYCTSYYNRYWGFCLADEQRKRLIDGQYHVKIDSELKQGNLNYAELYIEGKTEEEILLSSYCCHPSLANNELSGPCVLAALALWLQQQPKLRYNYRIVFTVETIGSIIYINKHLQRMKEKLVAGYVLTCCGDNNRYSFSQTRLGDTLTDRVTRHTLKHHAKDFEEYKFLEIGGSDNIQYCSPNVDLPVCTLMRSAHGTYKEYHNSLDNLDFISPEGLEGTLEAYKKAITLLEHNQTWRLTTVGEPQLSKYGLYNSETNPWPWHKTKLLKLFLAYADGSHDLIEIAERIDCNALSLIPIAEECEKHNLIKKS